VGFRHLRDLFSEIVLLQYRLFALLGPPILEWPLRSLR
jgi:hypothetical protein